MLVTMASAPTIPMGRKAGMVPEMSTPCLVDDDGNLTAVGYLDDAGEVRQGAQVSGLSHEHGSGIRICRVADIIDRHSDGSAFGQPRRSSSSEAAQAPPA